MTRQTLELRSAQDNQARLVRVRVRAGVRGRGRVRISVRVRVTLQEEMRLNLVQQSKLREAQDD